MLVLVDCAGSERKKDQLGALKKKLCEPLEALGVLVLEKCPGLDVPHKGETTGEC